MNDFSGEEKCLIWLIADSEPEKNSEELDFPLDSKHPTVHNIWTPLLELVQDEVFKVGKRIDKDSFYVRNAVKKKEDWKRNLDLEINQFSNLVEKNRPKIIITFGSRSFEFTRRAVLGVETKKFDAYWSTEELGMELARGCINFDAGKVNILPLLHEIIARQYVKAHKGFCSGVNKFTGLNEKNYFNAVTELISPIFLQNDLNCWKINKYL